MSRNLSRSLGRSLGRVVVVIVPVLALAGLGCGPEVRSYERDGLTIHEFLVGIGNVWGVQTDTGFMVVDLGVKDDADAIFTAIEKVGRKKEDVTLTVVTHGHFDHAGPGKAVQAAIDAPIALGAPDVSFTESGLSVPPTSLILEGELARPFLDPHFPAFTPDILLTGGERLDGFGIPGSIVSVPGHTHGSVAVLLDTGDCFVGDLVRGVDEGSVHDPEGDDGHIGRAGTHLYSEDVDADARHLDDLLGLGAKTFFPGHGPYFEEASLRAWVTDHLPAPTTTTP